MIGLSSENTLCSLWGMIWIVVCNEVLLLLKESFGRNKVVIDKGLLNNWILTSLLHNWLSRNSEMRFWKSAGWSDMSRTSRIVINQDGKGWGNLAGLTEAYLTLPSTNSSRPSVEQLALLFAGAYEYGACSAPCRMRHASLNVLSGSPASRLCNTFAFCRFFWVD